MDMKYTTYKEVKNWLDEMNVRNYTIANDLTVSVNADVDLSKKKLKEFPIKFSKIYGNFNCDDNALVSLEGGPDYVIGGNYRAINNKIISLKGGPITITSYLSISGNEIENLEYAPKKLKDLIIINNPLKSLRNEIENVDLIICNIQVN